VALIDCAGDGMTYGRARAADPAALVQSHMPLVRKIAWHVHGRVSSAIEIEDLVQIGMVALVEAAANYEQRGHQFSTYASMRIRGAMIDHLRRQATMCRTAMGQRRELAAVRARLESRLGRSASEAEMAGEMGLEPGQYRELADSVEAIRHESLDELYSDQAMWFADDGEGAEECLEREQLGEALAGRIAELPEREALVLQLYFVEEMNLDEIGLTIGVGAARDCQIKKSALERLRASLDGWN
jgi:RNA polymerase sigma factor for flagellar operon FliA